MQDTTNQSTQVPPPVTNPLLAQPSQNLKSGINALQHKKKKKGKDVGDSEKRSYNLWYDLIAQLADSDDEEEESKVKFDEEYNNESREDEIGSEEENEEESDEDDDDESEEEEENEDWLYDLLVELYEAQEREKENGDSQPEEKSDIEDEIENVEADEQHDKTFFIATLFNNKRVKEEIPANCEDPGPCLVACKIKHAVVRECLCDSEACSSVMPYELYKFLGVGPLKKTEEIFTNADASVVSVAGMLSEVGLKRPNTHSLPHNRRTTTTTTLTFSQLTTNTPPSIHDNLLTGAPIATLPVATRSSRPHLRIHTKFEAQIEAKETPLVLLGWKELVRVS
ncbi:hypothetical protein PIB30_055237 [Stylosanthes scabra]|uniref:Uncharacterized protein n=1 Tax=Stylosanthes scabra TaxID=79078 RepID=A0ABU6VIQ9_9FABA|nr:hypothetical protein [Stylosanthes scabra]